MTCGSGQKFVKVDVRDRIATVTIDRQEALNALNADVLDELECAFYGLRCGGDADVVILTGAGRAFVAGADIGHMKGLSALEARAFAEKGQRVFDTIESMPQPVIAAVNGFALGGGTELAMSCDIRIASEKAKFGQPEVGLGVTPGFGGTQRLPRLAGRGNAKMLIYSGDVIGADEAYRIGLVQKIVPPEQLMDAAITLAKNIAAKGQVAVRLSKTMIDRGMDVDLRAGLDIEAEGFALCFASEDQREGMAAFIEKRKAAFKGK
ncbi:MAG: enoyl-CoA hydratase-related protein [Thermoplasmata archaeon]|nr:enoyl-CoA hydratase-related protein [Thermoplasmata archaeon]